MPPGDGGIARPGELNGPRCNAIARIQKSTRNPAATILLLRILNWHKYGKGRQLDGSKWVRNSWVDWAKETGLTREQVRKAFKLFEELNLVETRVELFRTRKVLHSRPTQRAEAISEGSFDGVEDLASGSTDPDTWFPGTHDQVLQNPITGSIEPAYIHGVDHGEDHIEITGEPCSSQEPPALPEKVSEEGDHMNMSEALKAGKEKTAKLIHKPNIVSALEHIWKTRVHEITGAMVGLKAKERGQLKLFLGLCPKGQAEQVLKFVLTGWVYFAGKAKSHAGLKTSPASPSIGFLLQHVAIAVMLATPSQSSAKPKPKEQEDPKATGLPKLNPVQSISTVEDDDPPATYEELVALSKGL